MSNFMQLRQELDKLLKACKPSSLSKFKDFLQSNRTDALQVVNALKSLHTEEPKSKALNLFDMVILPEQDSFPEYSAAFSQAGINRILPRGFAGRGLSDTRFISEIVYNVLGTELLVNFSMSRTNKSRAGVSPSSQMRYQAREGFYNLLAQKLPKTQSVKPKP